MLLVSFGYMSFLGFVLASGTKKTSLCNFAEARLLFWPVDQQMELSYSAINAPCA